jgi:HEAT repeat protein
MSKVSLRKKPYVRFFIIAFIIFAGLSFVTGLHGQYKLSEDQAVQLRAARTVRIIFDKPGGSASHVTFPVVETIKGLFAPAGLSVTSSGGDMVFKINFTAQANSRRYSKLGGSFAQTGYTGASVSGNVYLSVGEEQFLKKYFSGKEGTKGSIARGTYTKPSHAPFKEAFLNSSIRKAVMEILCMFNPNPTDLLISYLDNGDWYIRKDVITLLAAKKEPHVIEALHRMVSDESDKVRLKLAQSLGRLRNPASLTPLLTILADKDKNVRKDVLKSLDKIDSKWRESAAAEQMAPTWFALLNDKNRSIQQGAIEALIEVNDPRALKPMIMAMMKSHTIRSRVVKFLDKNKPGWKTGPEAMEAVDYFIQNLSASTRTKKQEAAKALGEIGAPRALNPLINQLKDPDQMVRSSTLHVLEEKYPDWGKDPAAVELVPFLIKLLASRTIDTKTSAVTALAAIDDPRVTPALIRALNDRSWRVKEKVINALGESSDPRVVKPLIDMLNVTGKSVKEAAIIALGKQKSPLAVEPLIRALKDRKYSSARNKAAAALGGIDDPRVIEPLLAALRDADEHVKAAAAKALGKQKEQRALKPLLELTKSKQYRVKNAAYAALKEIMEITPPAGLQPFINGTDTTLKKSALDALGKQRVPEAIDLLVSALEDKDDTTRLKAVEALAMQKKPRVIEPLLTALQDDNYRVRGAAAKALGERKDPRAIQPLIQLIKRKAKKKSTTYDKNAALDALKNMSELISVHTLLDMYKTLGYPYTSKVLPLLIDTKDPEATDLYIGILNEKSSSLRNTFIGILGSRKDRRAIGPIIKCLKSRNRHEKKKAAHALKVMTGQDFGDSYKKWNKWWKKNK